ncbi:MAG: ATP-dependent sacrificial sulfur transferase LarE [Dehalobacterium sp.]
MLPREKLVELKDNIKSLNSLTVAFSGGVDSTFLLRVAHDVLKDAVLAVTVRSATFPEREFQEAVQYAKNLGVAQQILHFNEFSVPGFSDNPPDRCYLCKKELFAQIKSLSREHGIDHVADGSNQDDLKDYRPGMKAIKELGIISPLQESELTKDDIRLLSKEMNLPTWNKPSFACLATRFSMGDKITKEKLHMVDKAEAYLIELGFDQVRVRCHEKLARIEVSAAARNKFFNTDLMDQIDGALKRMGFNYVSLDLQGYRTGSMNPTFR